MNTGTKGAGQIVLDWFTIRSITAWASTQDPGLGLLFIAIGLILMLLGWRFSRSLIALSLLIGGGAAGAQFLQDVPSLQMALILASATGCCALGIRFPRVGAAILTGGWAAFALSAALERIQAGTGLTAIAVAAAFFATAAISFAVFRESVAFVTSLEGSLVFLTGGFILLAGAPAWWFLIREVIERNPVFLPFLVLTGTVTGYHIQTGDMRAGQLGTFQA